MADLEEKGYLFHPHTSAGRVPTDRAYRYFVDTLMRPLRPTAAEQRRLRRELSGEDSGALERLIARATRVLGLLTGELGLAIAPNLDEVVLERIELVLITSEKVLLVLRLTRGVVRTVYVDVAVAVPSGTLAAVTMILNERLAGHSLADIRATLPDRLRDAGSDASSTELLNILMESAGDALGPGSRAGEEIVLGYTSVVASQPEFAEHERLRGLIELTEQRGLLRSVLRQREHDATPMITIGAEHGDPRLTPFTLVTSEYEMGGLSGVLGVMGPTRMPYAKVAALVEYTSVLVGQLGTETDRTTMDDG
jgi:heat-inducible transcriptional repressor